MTSRYLKVILAVALCLSLSRSGWGRDYSCSRSSKNYYVCITPAGVNLRQGPSTSCRRVGALQAGDIVYCPRIQGEWLAVYSGPYSGSFVSAKYMQHAVMRRGSLRITTSGACLRMRTGPGTQFGTLAAIPNGQYVPCWYTTGSWYYVQYRQNYGWISARYVR